VISQTLSLSILMLAAFAKPFEIVYNCEDAYGASSPHIKVVQGRGADRKELSLRP
jgi:hypothetical protein